MSLPLRVSSGKQIQLPKIQRPLERIWIFWRQKEPSRSNMTSVGPQVRPRSWEILRRISAVYCRLKFTGVSGVRATCAVYITQMSPLGCWKRLGFCSERVASSEIFTGAVHWLSPAGRRLPTMEMSALPSSEPANQTHSRSPFCSSSRSAAWQLL